MMRACLSMVLLAAAFAGCSNSHDETAELTSVEVGADALSTVDLEREVTLAPTRLPSCLDVELNEPSSSTTVAMQSTPAGCTLTVHQPDLILLDADEVEKVREASQPFDVDAVRSGSVVVKKLELNDGEGEPLVLSRYVTALSLQVDGETLLDRVNPSLLDEDSDTELTRELPGSVIDKLKTSVDTRQIATTDVALTLYLQEQSLTSLPGQLKLRLVMQPQLAVSLVDAR
ncbi:MAG: hypothetical protein ABW321_07940 [Polyangiales bacterium]